MTSPHADRPDPYRVDPAAGMFRPTGGRQPRNRRRSSGRPHHQPLDDGPELRPLTEIEARRLGPLRRYFARHPRVMDALVCGAFGLAMVSSVGTAGTSVAGWAIVTQFLAAAGATIALYWRRRAPIVVTAIVTLMACLQSIGLGGDSPAPGAAVLGLPLTAYAVAANRRPRTAWLTMLGSCLTLTALFAVSTSGHRPAGSVSGTSGVVVEVWMASLIAMAIGNNVRAQRQHTMNLVERTNALVRDRDQRAVIAVIDERTRIAREMHDIVAHSLTVMIALADGAKTALDREPNLAKNALTELSGTGRSALADMRRLLGVLRESDDGDEPAPLTPTGWDTSLEDLLDRFRATGLSVRFRISDMPQEIDAGVRYAVRRIMVESLTNALRYAPGSQVDITVSRERETLVLVIANGPGTVAVENARVGAGRGIVGMRERTAMYGGTLVVGPAGDGWRVRAEIPLAGHTSGAR